MWKSTFFRTEKQSITERRASNVSPTREGRYFDIKKLLFILIFLGASLHKRPCATAIGPSATRLVWGGNVPRQWRAGEHTIVPPPPKKIATLRNKHRCRNRASKDGEEGDTDDDYSRGALVTSFCSTYLGLAVPIVICAFIKHWQKWNVLQIDPAQPH